MSKLMNDEKRDQAIKELMISVRRNTQISKCIDAFERLLNEISDKDVVDTVIADTHCFVGDFLRLGRDVDNMKNIDFISRILTHDFIKPYKFFNNSKRLADLYLSMSDILQDKYYYIVRDIEKKILLPNVNFLGDIEHKDSFSSKDLVKITNYFGDLSGLSADEVKEKYELARKVVLLYNYLPAVVKAFIQTKRRGFNLDKNSKKFE